MNFAIDLRAGVISRLDGGHARAAHPGARVPRKALAAMARGTEPTAAVVAGANASSAVSANVLRLQRRCRKSIARMFQTTAG